MIKFQIIQLLTAKVLDGTYAQDIRAGNTNIEVVNLKIDRMNTDVLGGTSVNFEKLTPSIPLQCMLMVPLDRSNALEGQVEITKEQFNVNFREFTIANAGGAYTISGTD